MTPIAEKADEDEKGIGSLDVNLRKFFKRVLKIIFNKNKKN